jgi:hypothetical protein
MPGPARVFIKHYEVRPRILRVAAAPTPGLAELPGISVDNRFHSLENMEKEQSRHRCRALQYWLLVALLWLPLAHAAPLPPTARLEIDSLLSRLAASGCQFKRNGTWYTAAEAQAHLRRKLDYLVDKGMVASAEQFIERAASKSSVSGQAYQVKCDGNAPVPSSTWLFAVLEVLRSGSTTTK